MAVGQVSLRPGFDHHEDLRGLAPLTSDWLTLVRRGGIPEWVRRTKDSERGYFDGVTIENIGRSTTVAKRGRSSDSVAK